MARCQATTKSGARCKRNAAEGEDRCSVHNRAKAKSAGPTPGRTDDHASDKEAADHDAPAGADTSKKGFRSKHINSGEDLLHLAIGVAATLAMLWLLKRIPRPPGF